MGLLGNFVKTNSSSHRHQHKHASNQATVKAEFSALLQAQAMYNHQGKWVGVRVRRGDYTVDYHRTNRTALEIFNHKEGELHGYFPDIVQFATVMRGKSILDIGCGNGALVKDLREHGLHAQGIDLLPGEGAALFTGDAYALPYAENTFDCVISIWSVFKYEPAYQIRKLLDGAFSVLKPGGRILLSPLHDPLKLQIIRQWCERNQARLFQVSTNQALQILKI